MRVDHVVMGVADLDVARAGLAERAGLAAVPGGRHRGWGTANALVPLGDTYLELVTVVDAEEAASAPFGRWVGAMAAASSWWGWVVRTETLSDEAERLGLEVAEGMREGSDGRRLTWSLAGVEQAERTPSLPFLIQWGDGTPMPGRALVVHPCGPCTLAGLTVAADVERLDGWLGGRLPDVSLVPGDDGVVGLTLVTDAGVVSLTPADLAG